MHLEAAFEHDLRIWLVHVYKRLERMARQEDSLAAEGIVEQQNRLFMGLIVVLAASIMLLPWAGGAAVIGGLLVLYVGALVSSTFTAIKLRKLEHSSRRRRLIDERRESVWQGRPSVGPDERAQLIRIMNLSSLRESDSTRAALAIELKEARRSPVLARWQALDDAQVLMRETPSPAVE